MSRTGSVSWLPCMIAIMQTDTPRMRRPSRKLQLKNLLRHCEQKNLTVKARLLLVVLFGFTDDDGCCWPSQETLMALSGLSETAVKTGLRELARTHTVMQHRLRAPMMIGTRRVKTCARVFLVLPLSRHTAAGNAIEAQLKSRSGTVNDVSATSEETAETAAA